MNRVKSLDRFVIATLLLIFLAGCKNLPAVVPTSAEVASIQVTVQPSVEPRQQENPSPEASKTAYSAYPAPQIAYPNPQVQGLSVYPYPGVPYLEPEGSGLPTLEPYVFKTSQPGTVTIRGILAVLDPVVMMPAPDDAIYLVPLSSGNGGPATVPPIEKGKMPQAEVDEHTGEFVFTNILPGQYAVVVVTLGGSEIPVRDFDTNNLAIITIQESDLGKTIDLGYLAL
ncbi:MAG: hypothetical protein WHV66_11000 [Anaerolineales bacterium]